MATEGRFRKVLGKLREGWSAGGDDPQAVDRPVDERFVMKPGEVRIVKGGGTRIDRAPGEKRGDR